MLLMLLMLLPPSVRTAADVAAASVLLMLMVALTDIRGISPCAARGCGGGRWEKGRDKEKEKVRRRIR